MLRDLGPRPLYLATHAGREAVYAIEELTPDEIAALATRLRVQAMHAMENAIIEARELDRLADARRAQERAAA